MHAYIHIQTDGYKYRSIRGRLDVDGWMNGCNGWMDGWMDGCSGRMDVTDVTDESMHITDKLMHVGGHELTIQYTVVAVAEIKKIFIRVL
jgi:hypothetical protein